MSCSVQHNYEKGESEYKNARKLSKNVGPLQNINLSDEQKKEIKKELKRAEVDLKESIRRLYRIVAIPHKSGFKEEDLGIPTYGEDKDLSQEVYDRLRSDGEILENIAPLVLREKYLSQRQYVLTEQLYQSSLKTPGETRPVNKAVFAGGIAEGCTYPHCLDKN